MSELHLKQLKFKPEPMLKIAKLLRFWSIMLSDCAHQKFVHEANGFEISKS